MEMKNILKTTVKRYVGFQLREIYEMVDDIVKILFLV